MGLLDCEDGVFDFLPREGIEGMWEDGVDGAHLAYIDQDCCEEEGKRLWRNSKLNAETQ